MGDKDVTLVARSFMGQGDPVWLVRPHVRQVVAGAPYWCAKRVRALRNERP